MNFCKVQQIGLEIQTFFLYSHPGDFVSLTTTTHSVPQTNLFHLGVLVTLLTSRKTVLRKCLDLENEIRGLFKAFGIRLPKAIKRYNFAKQVHPIIKADEGLSHSLLPMLDAHETLYFCKTYSWLVTFLLPATLQAVVFAISY